MTASFVLDASLTLSWCFPDEATETTREFLRRMGSDTAAVPSLWFLEVANGIIQGERRGRLMRDQADEFAALVRGFDPEVDDQAEHRAMGQVLDIARRYTLSSYDALYLDLSLRRRLPLATTDGPLEKAARKAGVPILGI